MTPIEDAIKSTLAYFSLFDYPLTAFEIHKWLYKSNQVSLGQVWEALAGLPAGVIEERDGFFFLSGHSEVVQRRLKIHFDNHQKVTLAREAARLISPLPFWRLVAVTNTVAQENSQAESDIDWLVVVKARRLWTARFLMTAWLALFGRWRHGRQIANKICLSFFITENNLDLSRLKLPSGDVYLTYWPTQIIPLLSVEQTWEKFLTSNFWINRDLANFDFRCLISDRRARQLSRPAQFLKNFLERLLSDRVGDWLEHLLRRLQLAKMSKREARRGELTASGSVVINDQMLKFHEIDRRAEFHNKWVGLVRP